MWIICFSWWRRIHIPSSLIKLEFTESMFFNNNHVPQQTVARNCRMLIYLSVWMILVPVIRRLKYITYIPVDYLKLDKSIIDSYLTEEAEARGKRSIYPGCHILLPMTWERRLW